MGLQSNNKRIAKNTVFLYFRMAVVMFASLYLARVILKVLGVEDYGIYNVVCGFVFILNLLNLTLSHGVNRYYNEEIGKNNYEGVIGGSYRVFAKGMTVATAKVVVKTESAAKLIYTGQPVTLNQNDLTVTVGKTVLTKADYKIVDSTYINNINKGVAKVTIEGRGQYAGTKTISFTVKPQPVSWWKKFFDFS